MKVPSPYFIRRTFPPQREEANLFYKPAVVEEEEPGFWDYWRVVRRRRWLILTSVLATVLATAFFTFTRTPIYTAQATVLLERRPPLVLRVQDARSESEYSYDYDFHKTQHEIMKSRSLAARTIREEGLEDNRFFGVGRKGEGQTTGLWTTILSKVKLWEKSKDKVDQGSTQKRDGENLLGVNAQVIDAYLHGLQIKPVRGTGLLNITFSTPDPALSVKLANAHAAAYIRYGLDLRSQTNEEALSFLEEKLREITERIKNSEAALNSYRRDKGIIALDGKENVVVDRLVDLSQRLTAAEGESMAFELQLRTLRKRTYDDVAAAINSPVIQAFKGEIARLEGEHAKLSREFKPGYPQLDMLKTQIENARRGLRKEIETEVKRIELAYQAAKAKEEELRAKIEEQKNATLGFKDSAVQYVLLARDVDTNRQLYDAVLQRMTEVRVAADIQKSNVYVIDKAELPRVPSHPKKARSLLLGLLVGLAGGLILALFIDSLDNTFKTSAEVRRYLRLPNLVVVPDFLTLNGRTNGHAPKVTAPRGPQIPKFQAKNFGKEIVALAHDRGSIIAESYRTLRTAILLSQPGEPPRTNLITSATRVEGKTTTVINTAIIFAQMGAPVLIIDADLRRPKCHRVLGMENRLGLTELLTGHREPQDVIKPTPIDNLFFLSSGTTPPNPAELLGSTKMFETLTFLQGHYDFIFIDSSPVMPVSDTVLLSTMVDGVILVIDSQKAIKKAVMDARSRLTNSGAKILGAVLNRVDMRSSDDGYYYYHYYSYSDDGARKTR